jgi:hypothetical protein
LPLSECQPQETDGGPAQPQLLLRSDVVALLRADLVVGRGASPGLFELTDPGTGNQVVLYDFELSVARMLDGRRTLRDLIEIGERLGIPIDPAGLSKFQHQLGSLGFLALPESRAKASSNGPWSTRRTWDEKTRDRFRSGVKLVRSGRPDEAVNCFREILAGDPENPEAHEMLALLAAGHALAARPIGEVFERQSRPTSPSRRFPIAVTIVVALLVGGASWAIWSLTAPSGHWRRAASDPLAEASPPGRHRAPPEPRVAPVLDEVATTPMPLAAALQSRRTVPVERRWHPALAEVRAPAAGILLWRAPTPVRVARGERLGEVRAAQPDPTPEARKRLEEMERLAAEDPVYQEFVEKERAALAGAGAGRSTAVAAPAEGEPTTVVQAHARVAAGDLIARIVDAGSWRVSVLVRSEPPAGDAECEIAGDGDADRAACHVVDAAPANGAFGVTVAVSARAVPWLEHARAPCVWLGPGRSGAMARGPRP